MQAEESLDKGPTERVIKIAGSGLHARSLGGDSASADLSDKTFAGLRFPRMSLVAHEPRAAGHPLAAQDPRRGTAPAAGEPIASRRAFARRRARRPRWRPLRSSRTPVREAIRMLAASGLVEVHATAPPSWRRPERRATSRHVGDRGTGGALRRLCRRAHDQHGAARASRISRKLRVLIQSGDPQHYHEVNEAFHQGFRC